MNVIEIRDITLSLRGNRLFEGASATFAEGTVTGLVAPNGRGKSVLLKAICGFVPLQSGSIWIDPRFLSRRRVFPDRFGIAIDGPAYQPHATGLDNLLDLAKIRRRIDVAEVRSIMTRLGLDPDDRTRVRAYSLGMRQKLSLAQALMESPEVLLLDEPFNALDADSVRVVTEMLLELKAAGVTMIFTSHHRADIDELSDVVVRIERRQLVTEGVATG